MHRSFRLVHINIPSEFHALIVCCFRCVLVTVSSSVSFPEFLCAILFENPWAVLRAFVNVRGL